MHAVPEFGHALLKELGAPSSPIIETFAEVRFKDASGKTVIPDGAIVCHRGKRRWTCLVDVKTGSAALKDDQVTTYLEIARKQGFDGVLTISNQITAASSESPLSIAGRRLRSTSLWHFSWWRILTEAIVQGRYRGIADPDQAWILGELIAGRNPSPTTCPTRPKPTRRPRPPTCARSVKLATHRRPRASRTGGVFSGRTFPWRSVMTTASCRAMRLCMT